MKRLPISFVFILCMMMAGLTGCKQSAGPDENFITVDVTKSYPEKKFLLQDLFDIEYLRLETTDSFVTTGSLQGMDENIILMKDIGRVQSGNIHFVDRKSGKLLRTINRLGQGAGEYTYLRLVVYDKENQELYVNDSMTSKVLVYDLYGNFKRDFQAKQNVFYQWMADFDRDYLICYSERSVDPGENGFEEGVNNSGFMLVSKQDGSIRKISTPYEKLQHRTIIVKSSKSPTGKFYYGVQNNPLIPYQGGWLLMEISSDTIYRYTQNHTQTPFIVRTPSVQTMSPAIFLYPGVMTDRYCFLQTVRMEFDVEKKEGFETTELMYDRKDNSIYRYTIYNDDFTNDKEVNLVMKIPVAPAIFNNNDIAFTLRLDSPDLVEAYEEGKLKGKLKEIVAGLNEESNPVIMIAKYKKSTDQS